MNIATSSPNTEPTDNNPVGITPRFLEFARTRVIRKSGDRHSRRFTEEPRPTVEKGLDERLDISTVESGCSFSTSERGEHIGEDSSESIPSGVQLPLGGRANEHVLGKGEKENMPVFPYTAIKGFNAVKKVLESHPDDFLERSLVEVSQTVELTNQTSKAKELEARLTHFAKALSVEKEQVAKAYSWTQTTLTVSTAAFLFAIIFFQTTDALFWFSVLLCGLAVAVTAHLFYRVKRENRRQQFLREVVEKTLGTLKEKEELRTGST